MPLAYDSCNYPAFIPAPEFTPEMQMTNAFAMIDQCGLDVKCYQTGTNWTQVWMANGAVNILQAHGNVGDLVVGRIASVGVSRWTVSLHEGCKEAGLPLSGVHLPGDHAGRRDQGGRR